MKKYRWSDEVALASIALIEAIIIGVLCAAASNQILDIVKLFR